MDASRGIRTVETGGRLLEVLCTLREPVDLRSLAAATGLAASVTHAYLASFMRIGLARQDAKSKRYGLGPLALELGLSELQTLDPIGLALEALRELKMQLGQTVALSVWGSRGPTVIRVHRSNLPLHATLYEGVTLPIRTTATGRVFAAFMPPEVIRSALRLQDAQHIAAKVPQQELDIAVRQVQENGVARISGLPVPGVVSLSTPVFNHMSTLVCAVTVAGRIGDYDDDLHGPVGRMLTATAIKLSERLGMPQPPRG